MPILWKSGLGKRHSLDNRPRHLRALGLYSPRNKSPYSAIPLQILRKTTSVLPHWLLPRFQYAAPLILSSLKQYYVDGKKATEATGNLLIHQGKQNWGLLYRWGAGFLMHGILWGWIGSRLGVGKESRWSRDRNRHKNAPILHLCTNKLKQLQISD